MYRPDTENLAFTIEITAEEQEKRRRLGYGQKVRNFIRSFRDAAIMIEDLAKATKYRYDDLCEIYMESLNDGYTADEAWENLRDVSLEYDW